MSKLNNPQAQLLQAVTRLDSLLSTALAQDPFHPSQSDWRLIKSVLAEQLNRAAPAAQNAVGKDTVQLQRERDKLAQTLRQIETELKQPLDQ